MVTAVLYCAGDIMKSQRRSTVLVTGANGYIGSLIAEFMANQSYDVISSTRDERSDIQMDFSKPERVMDITYHGIDVVVHTVSPRESFIHENAGAAFCEGLSGIRAMLEFCVRNRIPKLVYLSSFHAIGTGVGIMDESVVAAPVSDYGMIHLLCEKMVEYYTRSGKVRGCCIRPSNVYGMPVTDVSGRWDLASFSLCHDAIMKNRIILRSSGTQLRNYVHAGNVVRCIKYMAEHDDIPILHCYGSQTLSIRDFARMVREIAAGVTHQEIDLIIPEVTEHSPAAPFTAELQFISHHMQVDQSEQCRLDDYVHEMCVHLYENPGLSLTKEG